MDVSVVLSDALRAGIGPTAAAYAVAAIGLNLQYGYAGLLNLGHAGFMAIGAYGLATTVSVAGGGFWLGILAGLVGATVFAILLGLPTVRLRADYLAITTIAAAEILRFVLRSSWAEPWTGGVNGLQRFADGFYDLNPLGPSNYALGPLVVDRRTLWLMIVSWSVVAVAVLVIFSITRSPWGRILVAIRQDEELTRSLGKRVFIVKSQALVIGGVLGGLGGILLAIDQQNVNPDNFGAQLTFFVYTIVILGGAGRVATPVAGAVAFWFVVAGMDGILRGLDISWLRPDQLGVVRFVLVGCALMAIVVFRPRGVFTWRKEVVP